MKKVFLISMFMIINLNATSLEILWQWYNSKQYEKICTSEVGQNDYFKYNYDEDFINMYAYSCLQTDMLNRLAIPIIQLRKTKKSRANSLYYSTILYQKKVLYHALLDGFKNLPENLPDTHYVLSKIYNFFIKNRYIKQGNIYIFEDRHNALKYRLYIKKDDDGFKKLVLESIKNGILTKKRLYW